MAELSRIHHTGRALARKVLPFAVASAALLSGCSANPATGKNQLNFYSEASEIQMGREADAEISAQMGLLDDPELQAYVSRLGKELAAKSERPGLPWTFKVMDDPMVNAFALPGGFIYVTRGILGHLSSEAELASVLGHEIGHVTAQHSMNQMSKAQLAQGGLLVGSILAPEVASAADLAGAGMQLLFLKYGRDDERQADDLGLRYMSSSGYETREMPKVFELLGAVSRGAQTGRVPSWLSSHPDPGDRAERSSRLIAERSYPRGEINGTEYVQRLDGLAFGPDPRQGYFDRGVFYHPELQFQLRFPDGWKAVNEASRVAAINGESSAMLQLQLTRASSPEAAAREFAAQQGVSVQGQGRDRISGFDATRLDFAAARQNASPLGGRVIFFEHAGRVYSFLSLAVQERWNQNEGAILRSLSSFARLTDPARLDARPQTIEVIRLPRAMSFDEFLNRYPSQASRETVALVNGVDGGNLEAGRAMKRIVGEAVAASN
jgi:predicted Zn-dependent protease